MVAFLFVSKIPVFWDFFIPILAEINWWVAHNLNQGDIHMKKLILSVILTIFITPNVFAGASVVDGGQYSETCRTLSGVVLGSNDSGLTATNTSYCATTGTISYASYGTSGGAASATYTKTYCNSCKSGYILETRYNEQSIARDCLVTWTNCVKEQQGQQICQGLPCQGMEDWESTTNGNEMKCDVSAGRCAYQCRSGYYDRGGMIAIGSAKTCAACPTNATCAGGTAKPSCNAGYYLTSTTSLNMDNNLGFIVVLRPSKIPNSCLSRSSIGNSQSRTSLRVEMFCLIQTPTCKCFRHSMGMRSASFVNVSSSSSFSSLVSPFSFSSIFAVSGISRK